jgi:hypothetical protein
MEAYETLKRFPLAPSHARDSPDNSMLALEEAMSA